jgi:hypothetical protein
MEHLRRPRCLLGGSRRTGSVTVSIESPRKDIERVSYAEVRSEFICVRPQPRSAYGRWWWIRWPHGRRLPRWLPATSAGRLRWWRLPAAATSRWIPARPGCCGIWWRRSGRIRRQCRCSCLWCTGLRCERCCGMGCAGLRVIWSTIVWNGSQRICGVSLGVPQTGLHRNGN